MKLPSFQKLLTGFFQVIKRFPLELLAAGTGTVAGMAMVRADSMEDPHYQIVLISSNLALTLFLSVSMFSESHRLSSKTRWLLSSTALLFVVLIAQGLYPLTVEVNLIRFLLLAAAFHLLVSFAPFIYSGSMDGFWEYNKTIFLRILLSGLYSGVLYIGIAIAVSATGILFDLKIPNEVYGYTFCLIAGIFNTTFFLSGIPENWKAMEEPQSYPRGLKVFTQYVLIPLASIYLVILLAYEIKIIIEWELPKGIVTSLVMGYAVYGMLSLLLVHPIRYDEGNQWMRTYAGVFYVLLIPLIALMGVAIGVRIDQYGVTESRYLIVLIGLWLIGVTLYFLFSHLKNIKVIPVTLCLALLLATWGPQSAPAVSMRSQTNRLKDFFKEHQAFENDKIIPLKSRTTSDQADALLRYLLDRYGLEAIQPMTDVNLAELTMPADTIRNRYDATWKRYQLIRDYFNIEPAYVATERRYFNVYTQERYPISLHGYDSLAEVSYPAAQPISWMQSETDGTRVVFRSGKRKLFFDLSDAIEKVKSRAQGDYGFVFGELTARDAASGSELIIKEMTFEKTDTAGYVISRVHGLLLLK